MGIARLLRFLLMALAVLPPLAARAQNYSDIWWDPSEGGWGLSLADNGVQLTGLLFGYDYGGRPHWYLLPTGQLSPDRRFFTGDVYSAWGTPFDQLRNPDQASIFRYGSVSVDFQPPGLPPGTALMSITMLGSDYRTPISYTKTIQRFPFGDGTANWGADHTDLWLSQARPDWGVALVQHGQSLYGVWFTYGPYGSPDWYFFSGAFAGDGSIDSSLYFTTGVWPSTPFQATQAFTSTVGTARLDFGTNQAVFTPALNGASQQWPVARMQLGQSPLAVFCAAPGITAAPTIFTASPINPSAIRWITPLGNLNPPFHALPTDHIYFYIADPDEGESFDQLRTEVVAPGTGTVSAIISETSGPEIGLYVAATADITYYLGHLIPDVPLAVGTPIQAGQHLGATGLAYALDLGLINRAVTQSFISPARYIDNTLHADGPLKYYGGTLQALLYAKTHRRQPECDGAINFDIPGRLSGNWFVQPPSEVYDVGYLVLSFARDTYDPSVVRVSVPLGWKLPADGNPGVEGGVMSIEPKDPRPSDVSAASGPVIYTLTSARTNLPAVGGPLGYLLVQMLDDSHIKAEPFGVNDYPTGFTSRAFVFNR